MGARYLCVPAATVELTAHANTTMGGDTANVIRDTEVTFSAFSFEKCIITCTFVSLKR